MNDPPKTLAEAKPRLIPVPNGMSPGFYAFMGAGAQRIDSGEILMWSAPLPEWETEEAIPAARTVENKP